MDAAAQVLLAVVYSVAMFALSQLASNRRIREKTESVKADAQTRLNDYLDASEAERQKMTDKAMKAQEEAAVTELKLARALARVESLEQLQAFDRKRLDVLAEDSDMLRAMNRTSREQITALNTLVSELRGQLTAEQEKLAATNAALEQAKADIAAANKALEQAKAETDAERKRSAQELAAERGRAEKAEQAHRHDQTRIAELEAEVGKLKLEIDALKQAQPAASAEPPPATQSEGETT